MKLELISEKNFDDVFKFEVENKEYFEETLPSRGDRYFEKDFFLNLMNEIEKEQKKGECYMYVIRDEFSNMVGRINFFNINEDKTAEIGYRIGKKENRKGYATTALEYALKIAFDEYGFKKIHAGTSTKNIGSIKILEKNGFVLIKKIEKYIKINGKWIDSLEYEKYK